MTARAEPLTAAQQVELGALVLGLRQSATWKEIEALFGMSRRQLWRHVRRHLAMSQQNRRMSHLERCATGRAA